MTERARKKLVVRRMEQVFAGKGAATGGNHHSIQQQQVSRSAANTDCTTFEAAGQRTRPEGTREAHIMEDGAEDPPESRQPRPGSEQAPSATKTNAQDRSEQRPTRPLDLDPQRAQVPGDNLQYMRQMGFSPLDPGHGQSPQEGHGWIYLNFLINMAQLHTINVTTEFVRKALSEYSNNFEISQDGCKVRWQGSSVLTPSSGGNSAHERISHTTLDAQSPRKRQKLSHPSSRSSMQQVGGTSQHLRSESTRYAYIPLFFHREDSDVTDDSSSEKEVNDSTSLPFPTPIAGDLFGMTSSGFPAMGKPKKQKHDDGPIIFYNNARFCTDLSEDDKAHGGYNALSYTTASQLPIGKLPQATGEAIEQRGPLAEASDLPESMDLDENPIPKSMELSFSERSPLLQHPSQEQKPIELEVTGIGGVWPADNFAISVQSYNVQINQRQVTNGAVKQKSKALPPRISEILRVSDSIQSVGPNNPKRGTRRQGQGASAIGTTTGACFHAF